MEDNPTIPYQDNPTIPYEDYFNQFKLNDGETYTFIIGKQQGNDTINSIFNDDFDGYIDTPSEERHEHHKQPEHHEQPITDNANIITNGQLCPPLDDTSTLDSLYKTSNDKPENETFFEFPNNLAKIPVSKYFCFL